ncbi:MAG: protein kinase [Fuerstiella sp.]
MNSQDDSENSPAENRPAYGTCLPSFPTGEERSEPKPRPAAGSRPEFGTLMAPPAGALEARPPAPKSAAQQSLRAVTQTYRADSSQMQQVLRTVVSGSMPAVSIPAGPQELPRPTLHDAPPDVAPGRPVAGKSTWNLRIRERAIAGHISGIINEIPRDATTATGLQSALAVDNDVPEYEVIGELGAGSMGMVYRARQTSLNRELAIKTLKPDSQNIEHDQAMFVSEAVVTANLIHPNIIPIHDLGRTAEGKLFYSMKQITGTSWYETIRERSLEDNLDILFKVCDAVAYAHSRGVINRDLKPENVVVGRYGEVIVLDWGLAVTTDRFPKKDSVVIDFRGGAGTPVYMPPELADEDVSRVGNHSDIYLLGAILFEILEGFPPHLLRETWDMTDPHEQLNSVLWAVMNNLVEEHVTNEGELMQIARKAMATNPADRYESVEAFQEAIRQYRITGRAEELMQTVELKGTTSYAEYQSAVALYEEALRKWPDNRRALDGDRKARLAYAEMAHRKGDIDLGLQIIPRKDDHHFHSIRKKLNRTRRNRRIVRGTWTILLIAAISLSGILLLANEKLRNFDRTVAALEAQEADAIKGALEAKGEAAKEREAATEARRAADRAAMEAMAAQQKADKALVAADQAQQKLDAANQSLKEKNEQLVEKEMLLTTATMNVIKATQKAQAEQEKADIATAQLQTVQKEADKARAEAERESRNAVEARFEGLRERVYAKREIRKYDEVLSLIDAALEMCREHEFLGSKATLLEKQQKEALNKLSGHTSVQYDSAIKAAVLSSDGTMLVEYTRGDADSNVMICRVPDDLAADGPRGVPLKFPEIIHDITLSADGSVVCAIGRNKRRVWVRRGDQYSEVPLPPSDGQDRYTFQRCLLAPDGSRLYLLGTDPGIPFAVYSLDAAPQQLLTQKLLNNTPVDGQRLVDAVLLPDQSGLIITTNDDDCRLFGIDWSSGQPQLPDPSDGALDRVFPELTHLNNLLGDGQRFKPQQLALSPDGRQLTLINGTRFIVLPRDPESVNGRFPFLNPSQIPEFEVVECGFDGQIRAAAFSPDGSRLVTAQDRYLQVWQKNGRAYQLSPINGLYENEFLAGHSQAITTVGFLNGMDNRILSIARDHTIRTWNTDSYTRLVEQMDRLTDGFPKPESAEPAVSQASAPPADVLRTGRRSGYILTGGPQPPPAGPKTAIRVQQARNIFSAQFSDDSERIVIGANDLAAHAYNSITGMKTLTASMLAKRELFFDPDKNYFVEGHIPEIVSLSFIPPRGDLLLTFDHFGSISVWDAKDDEDGLGYEKSRLLPRFASCEVAVSRDGQWIMAGSVRNKAAENPDTPISQIKRSEDEYFAVIWRTEDILESVDPVAKMLRTDFRTHITAAAFSPTADRAVTAGRRGEIVLWDLKTESIIARVSVSHGADGVTGAFFSGDNEFITAGFDGKVFRWTISQDPQGTTTLVPEEIARPVEKDVPDYIIRLRPDPSGKAFISSDLTKDERGSNYRLRLSHWSPDTGWEKLPVGILSSADDKSKPYRHDVSWSQDGKEVLYVHDETILVLGTGDWKVKGGFRLPEGHFAVRGTFAPNGGDHRRVATFDGRFAHLWELETEKHLAEFRSHGPVIRAGFSADRRFVTTASDSLRVFRADESRDDHGLPVFRLPWPVAGKRFYAQAEFSPVDEDYRIATVDVAGAVRLWNWSPDGPPPEQSIFNTGEPATDTPDWVRLEKVAMPNTLCWSPNAERLAAICRGKLNLWNVQQGQLATVNIQWPENWDPTAAVFNDVSFSADGSLLAAGGVVYNEDERLVSYGLVWKLTENGAVPVERIDAAERHSSAETSDEGLRGITAVVFDDARQEIITGGADSRLLRWQLLDADVDQLEDLDFIVEIEGSRQDGFTDPHETSVTDLDIAPNGSMVSADESGWFVIWPAAR